MLQGQSQVPPVTPRAIPRATAIRHELYYFDDGNVVFLLTNGATLFKLVKTPLTLHSDYFKALFTLPQGEHVPEGMDDANPIVVPEVTAKDFEVVCDFVHGRFSNTEQNLTTLLSLSSFFQMSLARAHAIHNLDILPTFSSVQRLHHGIHNDLSDWVARGFRELVHSRPIDELTMQEVELIGLPAYFAITRAKHRLFEHRLLVSFWTPEVVTVAACKRPRTCEEIWQREWWSGFAKRALQPDSDTEFSLETALNALDAPELMVAMCVECKKESVLAVKQSGCLADYRAIIEEELSLIS